MRDLLKLAANFAKGAGSFMKQMWHTSLPLAVCMVSAGFLHTAFKADRGNIGIFLSSAGFCWALSLMADRADANAKTKYATMLFAMINDDHHTEINVSHTYKADQATRDAWIAEAGLRARAASEVAG